MMYRGFYFSDHSVLFTEFTLGEYFVHVNIFLIAPSGTCDVCFQDVCMYRLCVCLSVSVFPTKKQDGVLY